MYWFKAVHSITGQMVTGKMKAKNSDELWLLLFDDELILLNYGRV